MNTTHTMFGVILLVRNPIAALASYFDHVRAIAGMPAGPRVLDFLEDPRYGAQAWARHTASWSAHRREGHFLMPVLYEDLVSDAPAVLRRVLPFLGVEADPDVVTRAVHQSTREQMSASERAFRFEAPFMADVPRFVRSPSDRERTHLTAAEEDYVWEVVGTVAAAFGYRSPTRSGS